MIDHVVVQVGDVEAALAFYLGTFGPIGMREAMRFPVGESFVVGLSGRQHLGFLVESRIRGRGRASGGGGRGGRRAARARETAEYYPGYYTVFLRDFDGHNVEAVHPGP